MKKFKLRWYHIVSVILSLALITLGIYIVSAIWFPEWDVWGFIGYFLGAMALLLVVGFILYMLFTKDKETESSNENIPFPIDLVDTQRIKEIIREELIKDPDIGIPYRIDSDGRISSVKPHAIEFRDCNDHADPTKQTPQMYYRTEVIISDGRRNGQMAFIKVYMDRGEDYIRKNWSVGINWNTSFNRYKHNRRDYPEASSQHDQVRLHHKSIEMANAGMDEEQVQRYFAPMLNQKEPKPAREIIIKPPKNTEVYQDPPAGDDDDDELDDDSMQSDIDKYMEVTG